MRPSHFHAPGMPNRLPDQRPYKDINGELQTGKTMSFPKVLRGMLERRKAEEFKRSKRNG